MSQIGRAVPDLDEVVVGIKESLMVSATDFPLSDLTIPNLFAAIANTTAEEVE